MKLLRRNTNLIAAAGLAILLSACQGPAPAPTESPQATATSQESGPTESVPTATPTSSMPAVRFASIRGVAGLVEVQSESGPYESAEAGRTLSTGAALRTGSDGRVVLELDDGTVLAIVPDTILELTSLAGASDSPGSHFTLKRGQVFSVRGAELPAEAAYEIQTANAVGIIRGSAMGIAYYDPEGVTVVTCLMGRCGVATGDATVDLAMAESCTITGEGICTPEPMDASEMGAWARALYEMRRAGLDIDRAIAAEGCACQDTDYVCDDGASVTGYAACLGGTICSCQDTTLVCESGSQFPDDPVCEGNTGSGVTCQCNGPHLSCDDGTVTYSAPACAGDIPCVCNGSDLVCGDTTYPSDPGCTAPGADVACTCIGTVQVCSDGTRYYNSPECNAELPCACQGPDLVCTSVEGVTTTYPGYCSNLPGGGNEPQCACVGTTLYCTDGTITQNDPSCTGGGGDGGSDGGMPRCACYDGDLICSDGAIKPNDPSCGG